MKNQMRYVVTLGAVLLYYLLSLFPLYHYPDFTSSHVSNPSIGLFALGSTSIYGGFAFIEIISFLINPLKRWRTQGIAGRGKIHRVQLVLMFLMAIFQGWGSGELIKSFGPDYAVEIFGINGLAAQIILCSCLVNGVLIFYLIATNVTQYGLVNGFILFLFVQPLVSKTLGLIYGIQSDLRVLKMGGVFFWLTH